jgi:hypothetical protein
MLLRGGRQVCAEEWEELSGEVADAADDVTPAQKFDVITTREPASFWAL